MPKLFVFDAFTLLICEKTVANYALLRCKAFSLKIWLAGCVEFWTNNMSGSSDMSVKSPNNNVSVNRTIFFTMCNNHRANRLATYHKKRTGISFITVGNNKPRQ